MMIFNIDDIPPITTDIDFETEIAIDSDFIKRIKQTIQGTITFNSRLSEQDLLQIITGTRISNNYLKKHGGIMRRKIRGRRR